MVVRARETGGGKEGRDGGVERCTVGGQKTGRSAYEVDERIIKSYRDRLVVHERHRADQSGRNGTDGGDARRDECPTHRKVKGSSLRVDI